MGVGEGWLPGGGRECGFEGEGTGMTSYLGGGWRALTPALSRRERGRREEEGFGERDAVGVRGDFGF